MSTPAQISQQARRNRRRMLIAGAAALLALAVLAGWLLGRTSSSQDPDGAASPSPEPSSPEGEFVVHEGEDRVDDKYPVKFPHDVEGAVSAAVQEVSALSTNDRAALAGVVEIYYALDGDLTSDDMAGLLLAGRAEQFLRAEEDFDIESFPAPEAYHYNTPIGVYWDEQENDSVLVQVLASEEISDGGSLVTQNRYVYGRLMEWDQSTRGGDWVVADMVDPEEQFRAGHEDKLELSHEDWTPIHSPGGST